MEHNSLVLGQRKTVLLIGNLTQEGVTTKVQALGYGYKNKLLTSSSKNWMTIVELIRDLREADSLVAVFVHFTPAAVFRAAHQDYAATWSLLLTKLVEVGALIFVYEDILAGKLDPPSVYGSLNGPYRNLVPDSAAVQLVRELYDSGIEVVPYKKRTDLTLRIQHALDEIEGGIFFRLYVPNGRLQAEQLASFLRLLESYLQRVEQISFSYDQRHTEHGTIYEFKSQNQVVDIGSLDNALARFEDFMNLVESDTRKATQLLESMNVSSTEAIQLITRYARDYRRLRMDIRHEFESKMLALRQRLEGEALDLSHLDFLPATQPLQPSNLLSIPFNTGPVTINVTSSSIRDSQVISTELAQIIQGDITYNAEDSQLIAFFEKYADRLEAITLRTALDQLKDKTVPEEERQTAKQKILGFLYKILPKVGETALKVLLEYLVKASTGP